MNQFLRLIRYLIPYRLRLIGAFPCSAVVAGLAGAYAWLLRPVLDGIFINKDEMLLFVLPLAILAVAVLKRVFYYGQNYLMNYVGYRVIRDFRQEIFRLLC